MPRTKNDFEPARLGVSATPGSLLTQLNSGIGFNRRKAAGERCDLTHCDLRNLDLRGLDAHGLDFSDTYFRNANLRGIDFSTALPQGASLNAAKISGARFPADLAPDEITLSVEHGTRMRSESSETFQLQTRLNWRARLSSHWLFAFCRLLLRASL